MIPSKNELELHLILYTKKKYKEADMLEDIKKIESLWAGVFTDYLTIVDIWNFVSQVYEKYVVKKVSINKFILESVNYYNLNHKLEHNPHIEFISFKAMIEYALVQLMNTELKDLPELPQPSNEILPVKETTTKIKKALHYEDGLWL